MLAFYSPDAPDRPESQHVEHFVRTGQNDPIFRGFSGNNILDRILRGEAALANALVHEVRTRTQNSKLANVGLPSDLKAYTRQRVEPMVRGLFPRKEVDQVLGLLENSVVFITANSFEEVLRSADLGSAWTLANMYLRSCGEEMLSDDVQPLVGLSEASKCYVSTTYFDDDDPFADFLVHEAAHVFHNFKRKLIGLKATRTKEWLLPVRYQMRETFAYSCEAYSRILELSAQPRDRQENLDRLRQEFTPPEERVDADEYFSILAEAIASQNGWRRILDRCS